MKIYLRKGAKNIFGPALRRARLESRLHMTQADLAEELNAMGLPMDRSAISRIENQERSLSDLEFIAMARVLRIDPDKLCSRLIRAPRLVPPYDEFRLEDEEWTIRVAETPVEDTAGWDNGGW
jgi:transcriptional regulator with XRE-family HTH domain